MSTRNFQEIGRRASSTRLCLLTKCGSSIKLTRHSAGRKTDHSSNWFANSYSRWSMARRWTLHVNLDGASRSSTRSWSWLRSCLPNHLRTPHSRRARSCSQIKPRFLVAWTRHSSSNNSTAHRFTIRLRTQSNTLPNCTAHHLRFLQQRSWRRWAQRRMPTLWSLPRPIMTPSSTATSIRSEKTRPMFTFTLKWVWILSLSSLRSSIVSCSFNHCLFQAFNFSPPNRH